MNKIREQSLAVAYLRNLVEGRFVSPLLLVGPEGVGRKFSALQAAKELFSKGDPNSRFCLQVDQNVHPDLLLVVPEEGKSIGIDTIRSIIEEAHTRPLTSLRKFIVIDGADRMTGAAANAFLKTLEEPPRSSQFLLLAETTRDLLPTIRSRCGEVPYQKLSESFITEELQQLVEDPLVASVYARLAEGSLGKAVRFFGSNRLSLRDRAFGLLKSCMSRDLSLIFSQVDSFDKELPLALYFLGHLLRDMILLPHTPSLIANLDVAEELQLVSSQLGPRRDLVAIRLEQIRQRSESTSILLAAHVKEALGSTFVGK